MTGPVRCPGGLAAARRAGKQSPSGRAPIPIDAVVDRIIALTDEVGPSDGLASMDQIRISARTAVTGALSGTYRQIYLHAIAILMLADDEAVADRFVE